MDSMAEPPLLYVVDWLPPDFGAVGQYALIAARQAAAEGREVCLIGLTSGAPAREAAGTLTVCKLPAKPYRKSSFLRRLLWSFATNRLLIWAVLRHPKSRGAEVRFTGSPPFMLYFVVVLKLLRRCRLTYRITDFYPEAIIAHLGRRTLALVLLERLTWWLRQRVDRFEVLGEDQRALLVRGGISTDRIVLKRDTAPVAITGRETPLPKPAGLEGRKVLLYSGNYGVAHEVETVAEGLARHYREGTGDFGLWLNATGDNAGRLAQRLSALNIPMARTPPVPLDRLSALLAAADVHLVALRPEFAGIVLPSKIYGCILSGRPILFVGPAHSDVHLLCANISQRYIRVDPGDAAGFAVALAELSAAAAVP
jgi:hypothetical protein